MPEYKKQHFVSKFYLKNFSVNDEGNFIGLFNIKGNKIVENADLTNQAKKDYFYGKDSKAEKVVGDVEKKASKIIKKIFEFDYFPQKGSSDFELLLFFIIHLYSRTEDAEERVNEMIDKSIKQSLLRFYEDKDSVRIGIENAIQTFMSYGAISSIITFDLDFKIIKNKTKIPFITSDNPTVLYNQFLEVRRPYFCNIGFATKGLQVFFPISPNYCLLFFDEDVYGIGNKKANQIEINDIVDIEELNGLQFISANKNIYFNENFNKNCLDRLVSKYSKFRRSSRAIQKEFKHDTDENRILVMTESVEPKCNLKLSFIRILRKAQKVKLELDRAMIPRNEKVLKTIELVKFLTTQGRKAQRNQ